MNKLQLYITKSFDGYKVLFNINPSEEVSKHVHELRKVVEKVSYDPNEKNIFYYVTNISSGTFVTIIRTIPTAPVDHLAAWIFIPNELVIDGETLKRIVNTTTRKVSGERVTTDDVANLRELFATEYMTDNEAPSMTASQQHGELAWRRYNGDSGVSLTNLFGIGLFQLPYLDYSGVMFVDGDLGITVNGTDLTSQPLNGPAVILPAPETPERFVAYAFGRQLDRPMKATRDTKVSFVWKHAGFEDVVKEETIDSAEFLPTLPDTSASRKAITLSSFQIMAQSGRVALEDCTVMVNGKNITNEPHLFTTAELTPATIYISCEGYTPYSAKMDLASSTRALIRMQERTKVYCFEMPVKSAELGAPVRFKLYSKKQVTESPLEGYTAQDHILEGESRTNHLAYSGTGISLYNKAVYIGIGLVAGLILGWITGCGGGEKQVATEVDTTTTIEEGLVVIDKAAEPVKPVAETTKKAAEPVKEQPKQAVASATVTKSAIDYLDNNASWTKDELESYSGLVGLFDDLNNFRLEKLANQWGPKLNDSKRFRKLAEHAKNGLNPKKKAKSKIEGNTFLTDNGTKITFISYINRIDP